MSPQPTISVAATPPPAPIETDPDLLFADSTISESGNWRQLSVKNAAFSVAGGMLASTYQKKGSWAYAVRELSDPETVVRVGGRFVSSGLGYYGWLCGDSSTGRFYGAVPETDGSLVFIAGGYAGVEPLERYDALGAPIADGVAMTMGIECAIDHGKLWIQAFVDDGDPIAVHEEDVTDVSHFDVIGMYGEALAPDFTMSVDQVVARGAGGATGSLSLDALPLVDDLALVAADGCQQSTRTGDELVAVECYVQDEGAGPEFAQLARYGDDAAMRAVFAADENRPVCPGASATSSWAHGSMRCVAQDVGIRVDWTDDRQNLVGRLIDVEGDVPTTLAAWQSDIVSD